MSKKQIHVRFDEDTYYKIKARVAKENTTLQSFMEKAALNRLNESVPNNYESLGGYKFRFIDLFAGIGGMRIAFSRVGGKCVFSSEWDKFCKITYMENYGEEPKGDITKIDPRDIPDHDILLAGFPCQPFSIAGVSKKNSLGKKHGFLDKTQGTLFFDIARILECKRPRAFLLENVKNLKSHDRGRTFTTIEETLDDDLNYKIFYKVINAIDYVPQNRERIYIVGFDREFYGDDIDFEFPTPPSGSKPILKEILEDNVDPKYTLSDRLWNYLQEYAKRHRAKGNGFGYGLADENSHTRTLSARYYKDGSEILIPQEGKNPRRLTPEECRRLMGFPSNFIIPVSDTQAYKQFGNSVAVPVVEAIAEQMIDTLDKLHETYDEGHRLQSKTGTK